MNGLEVLQRIMEERPTPVVVISGVSGRASTMTLQALERGAVDFVLKYTPGMDIDPIALQREIVAKVCQAARIRVVRSLPARATPSTESRFIPMLEQDEVVPASGSDAPHRPDNIVVIGASTGGPLALRELLAALPRDFSAGVLIVQHLPAAFTGVLAAQLRRHSRLPVDEAQHHEALPPGAVRVAPGDFHLLLRPNARMELRRGPAVGGHCPSIDVTMQAAAQAYGPHAKGVLLSGMGSDGVRGMLAIRNRGGETFAQDRGSSVIFGMPRRAIEEGVADHVGSPSEIAAMLTAADESGRRQAG